jgi:hypothetical protein
VLHRGRAGVAAESLLLEGRCPGKVRTHGHV